MASFNYVRKDGSLGTIEAPDSSSALKMLPADASPSSGVMAASSPSPSQSPTTKIVDTPKGQSGTINRNTNTVANPQPSPGAAPTSQQGYGFGLGNFQEPKKADTSPVFIKPPKSGGSSLVDFSNALDYATNLAKNKRNALGLDIMMPHQGNAPASDFSSILSKLNNASDTTAQNLTNRAIEAATPNYVTQQFGNDLYQMQYDASGAFMGATKIADVPQNGGGFTYNTATDNQGNLWQVQYDQTGKMVGQQLLSQASPENNYAEVSPGATLFDRNTGQAIYTAPTAAMQNGTGGAKPSAAAKAASEWGEYDYALAYGETEDGMSIGNGRGNDGYVDPNVYLQLYDAYPGNKADFLKKYPPDKHINPENTWIQPLLKQRGIPWAPKTKSGSSSSSLDIDSLFQ